jgi:hypothetical protein
MSLIDELHEAVNSGDEAEIERVQRKILLGWRDETLDENFISSIKGKTICRNIYRIANNEDNMSNADYMKMISSLITHNIIESEKTGKPLDDYPIKELYVLLGNFINEGSGDAVNECKRFIQERYSQFL